MKDKSILICSICFVVFMYLMISCSISARTAAFASPQSTVTVVTGKS